MPTAGEPFEVDLGLGPDGAIVAAYPRHGDLYLFDFGTGREGRLARLSTARRERLPAVWRKWIAFVRAGRLLVAPLRGGHAREVGGGRGATTRSTCTTAAWRSRATAASAAATGSTTSC